MKFKSDKTKSKKSAFILYLLFVSISVHAQVDSANHKKNAIFFEMGGAGGSHSMNYERTFPLIPLLDFTARGGFGFDNLTDFDGKFNPNVVLPFMAGLKYGNTHKVEIGIGQTFSNIIETDIQSGLPARKSNLSTTFNIGYRYQNPRKNILIRAGYTPYIEFNETYKNWAGVSIGFLF